MFEVKYQEGTILNKEALMTVQWSIHDKPKKPWLGIQ
jgi:hypothetical protein